MRSSFKINSSKNNNDGQWMQKKRKREETSRLSLPGSSQKSPKRTKLTPDGKYSSLTPRQNEHQDDEDIQSSPQDLQITSSPITLSPIKAPTSPYQSSNNNFDQIDYIESSPIESSNRVPEVKLERNDSISLLRQSNDEFLAAASRRVKTTTPDKKSRLSPSPLKLPSSQSSPKNTRTTSPPLLPTRVHRSQPVPRKLENEFDEEIEDDIDESEEHNKYKESTLMVSNIEEIDAAFKGDDIEDEIDSSPVNAVSKFSPLAKHHNDILKQMRENAKVSAMNSLHDSIEESQESQRLDEMLTMESTHRTPTKFQQPDIEDIDEHYEEDFERSNSPPAGQQVHEDHIDDSPDHVPESPPIRRASPNIYENQNLRLLVDDDVDDHEDEDDIFTATIKEEKEARELNVGPIKFNLVNNARAAEVQPQPQQQNETWNTADKIRGSFISPLKRTQQPVVLKEGLRIKPVQTSGTADQTFLHKISVNSGQFTQFVPNEENTGRKGMANLVKGGLAERMAKLNDLDKHKRKQSLHQLKTGEASTDMPVNLKVIKVKTLFNHLSVARCRLDTGEYATVAFKHEKENVDVELPQVVEGVKLTLIPPYYSIRDDQAGTSALLAAMYVQQESVEEEQDDMLSDEPEDSPLLAAEKLFATYGAPSAEFQHEPMQIVPITKPAEHVAPKEDTVRVFVQRVISQRFAHTSAASSDEAPRKKSRAKPALGDLCDGFFLHKLKQLQISQYNTDKSTTAAGQLGARLIAQSSPNTVTVIDVKCSNSEAVLRCEGKWINIKGLVQDTKLGVGGVPFGRIVNHLQSTDEFTFSLDSNTTGGITYSCAPLVALNKLTSVPVNNMSVLGKVVFVDKETTALSVSEDNRHTVYVSDGSKTVVPVRVMNEHQVSEGRTYLFVGMNYRDNICYANEYSAVEEVRWVQKSAVNYNNTNALPGLRVLDKETVAREIGVDDTLCAALGIDIKALQTDDTVVPVPRDLSRGAVVSLAIKPTQVESQLQCAYCLAEGLESIAANTELAAALALNAQHAQFKCPHCRTIQSADRARKSFKVHGECRLDNKTIAHQANVAAALVEQWTLKQKRNSDPQTVIAKAVERCLCKTVAEHQRLRVDVVKSTM